MKKLKKIFQRKKFLERKKTSSVKKVIVVLAIVLFILLIFCSAIYFLKIKSYRLNFLSLKESWADNYPCHEECIVKRGDVKSEILSNWNKDQNLKKDWLNYWQESLENNNNNLQIKLLKLAYLTQDHKFFIPILSEFISKEDINYNTKINIINSYFSNIDNSDLNNFYYFILMEDGYSWQLKISAINALLKSGHKKEFYKISHLNEISSLLIDDNTYLKLKPYLFFLLADYRELFPEEVEEKMIFVFNNSDDDVVRYLIFDFLPSLNLEEPKLQSDEWEKYL